MCFMPSHGNKTSRLITSLLLFLPSKTDGGGGGGGGGGERTGEQVLFLRLLSIERRRGENIFSSHNPWNHMKIRSDRSVCVCLCVCVCVCVCVCECVFVCMRSLARKTVYAEMGFFFHYHLLFTARECLNSEVCVCVCVCVTVHMWVVYQCVITSIVSCH